MSMLLVADMELLDVDARLSTLLRATAVPGGTAERVLAMAILSVCPSVCPSGVSRPGTESSPGETETPHFHHMVA